MSGPVANYDNGFGGKKDECQGCIGISDEHTCEGHAEFLAMKAEKDKCQNCARLTAENSTLKANRKTLIQAATGRHQGDLAITVERLQARVETLEHEAFHYLWMLEESGVDSSAAKASECMYGDECPYFTATEHEGET